MRPTPTFIEGTVSDNLGQVVAGVTVEIPELNRQTTTDGEGAFTFGYGDRANDTIASGRYRLLINPGLSDTSFGSYRGWINIQGGRRNILGTNELPLLNPDIAFSFLRSGQQAVLNGGEVSFDFTNTRLLFRDGQSEGRLRMQFVPLTAIKAQVFDPRYAPMWAYAGQPVDVQVNGSLKVEMRLPAYQGGYDYAPLENELVVLLGLDPNGMVLRPAGVAKTVSGHRLESAGTTHYQVLDYIAYARVFPDLRDILQDYVDARISLEQLTAALQTYKFTPPDESQLRALEQQQ